MDQIHNTAVSLDDMLYEVQRELKQREIVFPRLIDSKKVRPETAALRNKRMRAVEKLLLEQGARPHERNTHQNGKASE